MNPPQDTVQPYSPDWAGRGGPPPGYDPYAGYGAYPPAPSDPFAFDMLLINQRAFSLADRYDVLDGDGWPRFEVHRLLRAGGMAAAGIVRFLLVIFGFYYGFRLVLHQHLLAAVIVFWAMGPVGNLVFLFLAPFRHIYLYVAGWGEEQPILSISQDNKISLWRRFTLFDDMGTPVAQFEKAIWTNLYRRSWRVLTPDGQLICRLREDSWVRSLARRVLGTFFGLLKTDFYFYDPEGYRVGTYRRRWTILDRYVLDVTEDPWRRLDRRVVLAAGILLDTGERR